MVAIFKLIKNLRGRGIVVIDEESLEEVDKEVNVDVNANGRQDSEMRDRYVDVPLVAELIHFMEEFGRWFGFENTTRFCW